jgi:hypothetical protein
VIELEASLNVAAIRIGAGRDDPPVRQQQRDRVIEAGDELLARGVHGVAGGIVELGLVNGVGARFSAIAASTDQHRAVGEDHAVVQAARVRQIGAGNVVRPHRLQIDDGA